MCIDIRHVILLCCAWTKERTTVKFESLQRWDHLECDVAFGKLSKIAESSQDYILTIIDADGDSHCISVHKELLEDLDLVSAVADDSRAICVRRYSCQRDRLGEYFELLHFTAGSESGRTLIYHHRAEPVYSGSDWGG